MKVFLFDLIYYNAFVLFIEKNRNIGITLN